MKKQKNYSLILLVRIVDKRYELKSLYVCSDFAKFLREEYYKEFKNTPSLYECCWFNNMILKYAAVCGIYRLPKNNKKCD